MTLTYKRLYRLTYSNEFGADTYAFSSSEERERGACQIIISWWDEINDRVVREKLREHLRNEKWMRAVELWRSYQEDGGGLGEEFHFHEEILTFIEVQSPVTVAEPPAEKGEPT
jgi:hypothetical protein